MKYRANLKKLASLSLVAVLAIFNLLHHPTAACATGNSTLSMMVLEKTVASQNCCCDSGDCCARRKADCSASPMDKILPVSLKLPALRLMPTLVSGLIAGIDEKPSFPTLQSFGRNLAYPAIKPAKLYLVNRTLLI